MSKLCCLCLLSACTYVFGRTEAAPPHTYTCTCIAREAVNRAWGIEKKYTGELLHDRDTASEGRSGHEERLYDRRTDATRLHLAHARKLARATKRRRVRRLSAFFYRNVCAKHKKALHIHSGWQCERERKRQRGRAQYTHTHTQAHAVAV